MDFSERFSSANVTMVKMRPAPAAIRLLWQLPHLARGHRMDLLHTQYIAPPFSPCATAVTVHDILFESHPEYFDRWFVLRSRVLVRHSVRASVGVFTVSGFSKRQISETYGVSMDKVLVAPNGVDRGRFFAGSEGREVVARLGLEPGAYFLTVGRLEPRKNHANLLRAWAGLEKPRPKLVIVGSRHFGYSETFDLIRTLQLEGDVAVLENASDEKLPSIFRNAKAFVYCSWAEGFGLPVLEAMASGVAVISSATTALSEVCGNAAVLVNPESVGKIRDAVRELDQRSDVRRDMALRGLSRVANFNWDCSAGIVRGAYLRYFGL
jgi:glycosyltransferase involved in cell wall biosynthesis